MAKYDVSIVFNEGKVSMRFLGIDFFSLEKVLGTFQIKQWIFYSFGVFDFNGIKDLYIQSSDNNIELISSIPIHSLSPIFNYFRSIPDREQFSIYKLSLAFDKFNMIYDDDSLLLIDGDCVNNEDFQFFNNLYMQVCQNLQDLE